MFQRLVTLFNKGRGCQKTSQLWVSRNHLQRCCFMSQVRKHDKAMRRSINDTNVQPLNDTEAQWQKVCKLFAYHFKKIKKKNK